MSEIVTGEIARIHGERRGTCNVCHTETIERKGGEWCPRCQGWLQLVSEFGVHVWRIVRPTP